MLEKLSGLALKLLESRKYVFNNKDLHESLNKDEASNLMRSGIIHCMSGCTTGLYKTDLETRYCFIHLTLQEFLAARSLVKKRQLPEIRKIIRSGLDVVVQFVSGLLQKASASEKPAELMNEILNELLETDNPRNRSIAVRCLLNIEILHLRSRFFRNGT